MLRGRRNIEEEPEAWCSHTGYEVELGIAGDEAKELACHSDRGAFWGKTTVILNQGNRQGNKNLCDTLPTSFSFNPGIRMQPKPEH